MNDESIRDGEPVVYPPALSREPDRYDKYARHGLSWETLQKDKQHLNLLSIFWYIFAGLNAFGAVVELLLIPLGVFLLSMPIPPPAPGSSAPPVPPSFLGYFYIGLGLFGLILYGAYAILAFFTAKSLQSYNRWTFCIVVSALKCLSIPLGTILGIFTIVVLNRKSVKEMFKHGVAAYELDQHHD